MVKPLWRMLKDAIHHIIEYTAAGKEGFFADRKTQDAVVRNLESIGEGTKTYVEFAERRSPLIQYT